MLKTPSQVIHTVNVSEVSHFVAPLDVILVEGGGGSSSKPNHMAKGFGLQRTPQSVISLDRQLWQSQVENEHYSTVSGLI